MKTVTAFPLTSRRLDVPDSFAAVQAYYEERGWTDGLPVVPATEDLVWEMLGTFGQNPAHVPASWTPIFIYGESRRIMQYIVVRSPRC